MRGELNVVREELKSGSDRREGLSTRCGASADELDFGLFSACEMLRGRSRLPCKGSLTLRKTLSKGRHFKITIHGFAQRPEIAEMQQLWKSRCLWKRPLEMHRRRTRSSIVKAANVNFEIFRS